MKPILYSVVAAILIACLHADTLSAQDATYLEVAYMKVAPGQGDQYLALEQELWKPVHQARVDAGMLRGWYLYRVLSPRGSEVHHNYTVVTVFDSFRAMESSYPEGVWEMVHPGIDMDEVWKATAEARDGVRGETWRAIDGTDPPPSSPAEYLMVGYMKAAPGARADYVALERDIWKPMHQAIVDSGDKLGWGFYGLVFPFGSELEYDYATVNAFAEYGGLDMSGFDFQALFESAHPGQDPAEATRLTGETRDMVRGEIWHLIDHVQAPEE